MFGDIMNITEEEYIEKLAMFVYKLASEKNISKANVMYIRQAVLEKAAQYARDDNNFELADKFMKIAGEVASYGMHNNPSAGIYKNNNISSNIISKKDDELDDVHIDFNKTINKSEIDRARYINEILTSDYKNRQK